MHSTIHTSSVNTEMIPSLVGYSPADLFQQPFQDNFFWLSKKILETFSVDLPACDARPFTWRYVNQACEKSVQSFGIQDLSKISGIPMEHILGNPFSFLQIVWLLNEHFEGNQYLLTEDGFPSIFPVATTSDHVVYMMTSYDKMNEKWAIWFDDGNQLHQFGTTFRCKLFT